MKTRATLAVLFRRHDPKDTVHVGTNGQHVIIACTPTRALELATALAGPGEDRTTCDWDERVVDLIAEAQRIQLNANDSTTVPISGGVR